MGRLLFLYQARRGRAGIADLAASLRSLFLPCCRSWPGLGAVPGPELLRSDPELPLAPVTASSSWAAAGELEAQQPLCRLSPHPPNGSYWDRRGCRSLG